MNYPGAVGAMETFTAQHAIKSSMLVKTQMNIGWKNLKDSDHDIAVPMLILFTMICHPGNKRDMYPTEILSLVKISN